MTDQKTDILSTPECQNKSLFGRRWKVSVLIPLAENPDLTKSQEYTAYVLSDSDYEDTSLRVTFTIQKYGWTTPNFSEISVYNMSPETENLVYKNGTRIMVEAGYKNGNFGVIYDAPIFQPLWEREDYHTFKVIFRCVDAMDIIYENHVATVGTALDHQKNMVIQMMSRARVPSNIKIADNMVSKTLSRPKVYFDNPMIYLRKWAQQNGTLPSVIDREIILDKPQSAVTTTVQESAIVLSPDEGGLVGTPQQTQDGVNFTCLLNPLISIFFPPMIIKIDNSKIRQAALQYNNAGFARLDSDGMYRVIGVTHIGDTRGNEWYSNVVGANQDMEGLRPAMFETEQDIIE